MDRFSDLPEMNTGEAGAHKRPQAVLDTAELPEREMRGRGCASKVGATTLGGALEAVKPFWREDVPAGLGSRDDAAVINVPAGKSIVQSVDFFPAIVDDPYLFGQITANHSLSDIYAMGAVPQSALAVAGIPFGPPSKAEHLLRQFTGGAEHQRLKTLARHRAFQHGQKEGPRLARPGLGDAYDVAAFQPRRNRPALHRRRCAPPQRLHGGKGLGG